MRWVAAGAPLFEGAWPEVLDNHIRCLHEVHEYCSAVGRSQVEGEGAFVARQECPPKSNAVEGFSVSSYRVGTIRVLNLDYVGPEVPKNLAGKWGGKDCRAVDNTRPPKGPTDFG